jgi:protein-S-isoprenylcysteine O-methyltransferase Ste14
MKRYILVPVALLIYLGVMAYFFSPWRTPISVTQYYSTIGVTLAIIVGLFFALKKRDAQRNQRKKE